MPNVELILSGMREGLKAVARSLFNFWDDHPKAAMATLAIMLVVLIAIAR